MNKEEQEIRKKSPVQIRNKKASFEYYFVDTYGRNSAHGYRNQVYTCR